jgi:hypothetical protein
VLTSGPCEQQEARTTDSPETARHQRLGSNWHTLAQIGAKHRHAANFSKKRASRLFHL